MDYFKESLNLHKRLRGKIRTGLKMDVRTKDDLSLVYSPGVAEPCRAIYKDPEAAYDYTIKGNTIAIVTDGSAVLGLGDIGPLAAIPVMEGKAMLFKRFADLDAFPICLDTQDVEKIIETVRLIAPVFGGINLEDISSPRSFEIEQRLQDLGIPVFHDDQHGTAIVTLAALINSCKITGRKMEDLNIVISGAGAAGIAIARLLRCVDNPDSTACTPVKDIVVCDSKGAICSHRTDLNPVKQSLLNYTNSGDHSGTLQEVLVNADVFIGVSTADLLNRHDIMTMAPEPIIFAMANPVPEIMPDEAKAGGAVIVGTGRSDLPNQINNVLGFPGIFRGAIDARAPRITPNMKLAAARAIADHISDPTPDMVIPPTLDERVAWRVAEAVQAAAELEFPKSK